MSVIKALDESNARVANVKSIEMCPRCGRLGCRKELLDPPADEPPKAE